MGHFSSSEKVVRSSTVAFQRLQQDVEEKDEEQIPEVTCWSAVC